MPRSPDDILVPGGQPIGNAGSDPSIREVPGGDADAVALFNELAQGGTDITPPGHGGKLVRLPGGGFIGLRLKSKSGPPTIDVNLPGIAVQKVKFV